MTFIMVGGATVDAAPVDFLKERDLIERRQSKLPPHEQVLMRHFMTLNQAKAASFDCVKQRWIRHKGTDTKFNRIVKQDFRLAVADAKGQISQKDTLKLLEHYVKLSGYKDVNAFGHGLDQQFGRHKVPIPRRHFVTKWGTRFSYTIHAVTRYHIMRLVLLGSPKTASVFLAMPYDIQFWGERTYDCEKKAKIKGDSEFEFMDVQNLVIPDERARKTLKPLLERELKLARFILAEEKKMEKVYEDKLNKALPADQDKWRRLLEIERQSIESSKKNVKRLKERLLTF